MKNHYCILYVKKILYYIIIMFIQKNGIKYIAKEDADIVALQETKCDSNKLPEEIRLNGYHYYFLESINIYN